MNLRLTLMWLLILSAVVLTVVAHTQADPHPPITLTFPWAACQPINRVLLDGVPVTTPWWVEVQPGSHVRDVQIQIRRAQ